MDMLLRDPSVKPTDEVLAQALGKSFAAYEAMRETVANPPYGLELSWRYYNDGKAWLCKACFKKKTVFWMSAWPGFFKITIFFMERYRKGILDLDISQSLKDQFIRNDRAAKYFFLTFEMKTKKQIKDLLKGIEYKKSLK